MDGQFGSVVLILLLSVVAAQQSQPKFVISAPNVFRVGVDETVLVSMVTNTPGNRVSATVRVYLRNLDNDRLIEKEVTIRNDAPELTTLKVLPENLPASRDRFQYLFLGAESLTSEYSFGPTEQRILVSFQAGYVFIQTDKPIYTASQTVHFRVLSLDQDMRPSDRQLRVEVINPQGISIKRSRKTQAINGFLEDTFEFPLHPVLGHYSVVAFYGHEFQLNSSVKFEVKEYVLPTFSVKVKPSQRYILNGSQGINTTIEARYVYGKPVDGHYLFKFGVWEDGNVTNIGKRTGQIQGSAVVRLTDLDRIFGVDWFETFEDAHFHAEAIVYERATGFSEAGINKSAIFVNKPYQFSLTTQYFTPGLPIRVKIALTYPNGQPATGVQVRVNATTRRANRPPITYNPLIEATNKYGYIVHRFQPPPESTFLDIECHTRDTKYPAYMQASSIFRLQPTVSPNGRSYIKVVNSLEEKFKIHQSMSVPLTIYVTDDREHRTLYYMFITRGKIVKKGVIHTFGLNHQPLQGSTTEDMVPTTRLVVYYITQNGFVIADSLLLELEEKCHDGVSVSVESQEESYRPHQEVQVTVTAPSNATVGMLAVDKAVYLLQSYHRLTNSKMFKRMNSYDMGCGYGGGLNPGQAFKDAGLTVITNGQLDVPERRDLGCSGDSRQRRSVDRAFQCLQDPALLAECPGLTNNTRLINDLQTKSWNCGKRTGILHRKCNLSKRVRTQYKDCCNDASRTIDISDLSRSADGGFSLEELEGDIEARSDFRETWFFEVWRSNNTEGGFSKSMTIPSSITEWKMTAVSISPDHGMCINDTTSITVLKPFFIQLHLPYSVVRLEQTQIVVTVFNYRDNDMSVTVNLTSVDELCVGGALTRTLDVGPNNATSTTFVALPLSVGSIPIRISAVSNTGTDIVEKKLKVVAEGVTKTMTRSVTLNPSQMMLGSRKKRDTNDANTQLNEIPLEIPYDTIPRSESCSVNLIGNLLGVIVADPIEGLEHLISRPTGCGEQTMIRLAPTLFTYEYIRKSGGDTADLEGKVYDYVGNGIQRILRFRHSSGAYSAFVDRPGSTWLTAFVVKVLSRAAKYPTVTANHIPGSVEWIMSMQQNNGAFKENTEVIHQKMIGAVNGDISMTAFVLISLLESREKLPPEQLPEGIDAAVDRAKSYLEDRINHLVTVYDKAIVTYALVLARSDRDEEANERLKAAAIIDEVSEAIHWEPDHRRYSEDNQPFWLQSRPSAISVETTGYALLAQMLLGDYDYAGHIAAWLSEQQNYQGGFVSTQDTVIALQALANYTGLSEFNNIAMECDIGLHADDQNHIFTHSFNNMNAKVQREFIGTSGIGGLVRFTSRGSGIAKANVEIRYNTIAPDKQCPFELNISAAEIRKKDNMLDYLNISVCVRYRNEENSTRMSIIDVGLYSGFEAESSDLKNITATNDLIGMYEKKDRSVVFYADEIPSDRNLCFSFKAKRDFVVGNTQPVPVSVYDYYNPDERCTKFNKPDESSPLLSLLCSGSDCLCSTGKCGHRYDDDSFSIDEVEDVACKNDRGYVLQILINSEEKSAGFRIYNITVLVPIKTGVDFVAINETRQLYVDQACYNVTPNATMFKHGKTYLLAGTAGLKFTREDGYVGFKYVIDSNTRFRFWPSGEKARRKKKARDVIKKLEKLRDRMILVGCREEVKG